MEIAEKDIVSVLERLGFGIKKVKSVQSILKLAKSLKGRPYKYGASVSRDAPREFDCSSFTSYVFARSGVQIPRMTIDQYFYGEPVREKDLAPGDLVFSNTKNGKIFYKSQEFIKGLKIKERGKGIDHCGIYIGKGKVIHASRYNHGGIIVETLKKSKQFRNISGFRRFISEKDDLLVVSVPHLRLDIRRKEDLIEEVGRVYGYEKILPKLPEGTLVPAKRNDNFFYADIVRNVLAGAGFSEVYNYSFGKKGDIPLFNPIAKDKQYLRTSLLECLRKNAEDNLRYFDKVKIFEIGKIFPAAGETISLAVMASNASFYEIKGVADMLLQKIGLVDVWFNDLPLQAGKPERIASIMAGNTELGIIGHNGFEINFEMLVRLANEEKEFFPISKYPSVKRDIAVFVPIRTKVIEVLDIIENTAGKLLVDTDLFDIYEAEDKKSFAFHLVFQSQEKTLSDKEINGIMDKIIKALEGNLEWEVRK
jgi:hypothetical protein